MKQKTLKREFSPIIYYILYSLCISILVLKLYTHGNALWHSLDPVASEWPTHLWAVVATATLMKNKNKKRVRSGRSSYTHSTHYSIEVLPQGTEERWLSKNCVTQYQALLLESCLEKPLPQSCYPLARCQPANAHLWLPLNERWSQAVWELRYLNWNGRKRSIRSRLSNGERGNTYTIYTVTVLLLLRTGH